ncbi:MAG: 16S rRNA (guanine(527)-N(7))-methyltransferase RsmG [Pyrinomonadaceae bacterium]
MPTQADEFARALVSHAQQYEAQLAPDVIARLTDYFKLVSAWNTRLHLVAPCAPAEFATRHVLESLVALRFIPTGARFIDVGTGAGLPALPCLLARTDLHATLVEAATKKAVFLREALSQLGLRARAEVRVERFEQMTAPEAEFVTCRALERFTEMLPQLVAWSPPASTLLLFGGPALRESIKQLTLTYAAMQLPASTQRFLFAIERMSVGE